MIPYCTKAPLTRLSKKSFLDSISKPFEKVFFLGLILKQQYSHAKGPAYNYLLIVKHVLHERILKKSTSGIMS